MRKYLFLFLVLLALCIATSFDAHANGRGFGVTYGTSATLDSIQTNTNITPQSRLSFFSQGWIHSPAAFAQLFGILNVGGFQYDSVINNRMDFTRTWSGSAGGQAVWSFPIPSSDTWHTFVATYDGTSSANAPIVYVDGVSVTVTTRVAASGTIVSSANPIIFGNIAGAACCEWYGKIGDSAIWNGSILTATEALELSKGANPLTIHGGASYYWPIFGKGTAEPDYGPSHLASTVTGTLAAPGSPTVPLRP